MSEETRDDRRRRLRALCLQLAALLLTQRKDVDEFTHGRLEAVAEDLFNWISKP